MSPDDFSAALLRLAEQGPAGFFDLQLREGRAWYAPAWKAMLGYDEDDLADSYETWLTLLHPDDSAAAPYRPGGAPHPAGPFDVEFRLRHRRGHWLQVRCLGLRIAGAEDKLERIVGLNLAMEAEDDTAKNPGGPSASAVSPEAWFSALVKADRSGSLGPLAAGLGREWNELLTRILGGIALAKTGRPSPELEEAERACLAGRELAHRLIGLAKAEGERTVFLAKELLAEATKAAAAGSAAEITIDVPSGADAVAGDRAQLGQIFQNLIRNALEAMPPQPHRPRLQLRASGTALAEGQIADLPAGDYIEFEVRDNGSGIAPEHLERIWDPFFTTRRHGAGLGLPAALALARRAGGQIGVDSTPGVGTVFTVFLPRAGTEARARRAPSARFGTGRVLVLDDDPAIAALAGAMLDRLGYKSDHAREGEEAVRFYRSYFDVGRPYDAAILDLNVTGGMGGEEAFDLLRALDPDVRAIALHGGGEEESRRCLALGFCGCLEKPFRPEELGQLLNTVLAS